MSTSIIDAGKVHYDIVESGTKRGGKKLVGSDGFSYTVKRSSEKQTYWVCSIRGKQMKCSSGVTQQGDICIATNTHVHPCNPGVGKRTQLSATIKTAAAADVYRSAMDIVETVWHDHDELNDFRLPKPMNLKRVSNRHRENMRPAEPSVTDVMFEINRDYLQCDEFLRAEVVVDRHRHLVFATNTQFDLLKTSKRWFMDGTFKILKKTFVQLLSIYAFVRKEENMKQILMKLKDMLEETAVKEAVLDFETGEWSALRQVSRDASSTGSSVFGDMCRRKVYWPHITNARELMALPLLPYQHMQGAFQSLAQKANTTQLRSLVAYMASQWLTSSVYPLRSVSVYGHVIRTNNDVEGLTQRLTDWGYHFTS